MIYFKIYFTLIFVIALFTIVTSILMDIDEKREELWWKITKVNIIVLPTLIVLLGIIIAWFF